MISSFTAVKSGSPVSRSAHVVPPRDIDKAITVNTVIANDLKSLKRISPLPVKKLKLV